MPIQNYPLGQQDFREIIREGKLYVDKTHFIHQLIKTQKYYFLSRPRRFGKSLFLSTLNYLFQGEKELFKGLYVYDKWKFEEYPIIRISFSNIGYRTMGLVNAISNELLDISKNNNIEISHDKHIIDKVFQELIQKLNQKYQKGVVVLIDEYDKPIIDYLDLENLHQAKENREILKSFYSILKDADPFLKIVFITGVSKFSKVSIFSDLNNLTDLSIASDYNEICGISQIELEKNFVEELKIYNKEEIKRWYNGYKFHIKGQTLYNPYSLLNFFRGDGDFKNFWFTSGTPTFLMKMSKNEYFYKFETIESSGIDMESFELENIALVPLLFQTGYLTITGKNELLNNYILGFPNHEVREAYLQKLADTFIHSPQNPSKNILNQLLKSLHNKDQEMMQEAINSAFAHIPYDLWQKENEQYYHAIIHLLFSLLNVYIFSEVHTKNGRADAIVFHENEIYCMEFKLNQSPEIALEQIQSRGYTERFNEKGIPIHYIGINFNSGQRKVDGILWV
jgi:Predicted AAA-ATPase/PD-(D/E)XK nuclease superfamily